MILSILVDRLWSHILPQLPIRIICGTISNGSISLEQVRNQLSNEHVCLTRTIQITLLILSPRRIARNLHQASPGSRYLMTSSLRHYSSFLLTAGGSSLCRLRFRWCWLRLQKENFLWRISSQRCIQTQRRSLVFHRRRKTHLLSSKKVRLTYLLTLSSSVLTRSSRATGYVCGSGSR